MEGDWLYQQLRSIPLCVNAAEEGKCRSGYCKHQKTLCLGLIFWFSNINISFSRVPSLSVHFPPCPSHHQLYLARNTNTHRNTHANTPTLVPFLSPAPVATPCTDAAVAFLNEYLLKCHYKKWGVMLLLAGVYWRVNVSSHTWNTSLTHWIFTAPQHRGMGRDWGLAHLNSVSADKTNSAPVHTCTFNGTYSTTNDLYWSLQGGCFLAKTPEREHKQPGRDCLPCSRAPQTLSPTVAGF